MASDEVIRGVTADGVAGTPMPGFARRNGGRLSDAQIDVLATGMRDRWARSIGSDVAQPPYSDPARGDPGRGAATFSIYCARCHGRGGAGGPGGSAITEGSYLQLVSDQDLRTTVIAGRPDLGAPDWRGNVDGRPMRPREVTDVVAWLSAQRPPRNQPH
jgi:mono/diheme cytochrome c family protein